MTKNNEWAKIVSIQAKVVRRFANGLKPESDLSIQTRQYQNDLDTKVDIQAKLRMNRIYFGRTKQESYFNGAELARQKLQSKCDEFFASVAQKEGAEKKKTSILRLSHRKSTEQRLASELRGSKEFTVAQVFNITKELESRWQESNGKVATNFMSICQKLDSHKQIFQWFPSESSYTSTLCGAVTMIIQATVSYSNIAEQLSSYVAELSDSIGVCTEWLDLYDKPAMKARLSEIYEQFFDFFIKVATWYLKPKTSKWLDSLNCNFSAEYESAAAAIKISLQLIRDQAQIEGATELKAIMPHMDQALGNLEARVMAQIMQTRKETNDVGRNMYNLLLESTRLLERMNQQLQDARTEPEKQGPRILITMEGHENTVEANNLSHGLSRTEAEHHCEQLQPLIDQVGGSDGIRLAIEAGQLVADSAIVHRLGKWTQAASGNSQILWIIGPYEKGMQTSAQLAALGIISTAVQAKAQMISYICQPPHYGNNLWFKNKGNKAGVLAMVYSLIRQLLQFQPPNDRVRIGLEILEGLTRPNESWDTAIGLLKLLLENTPTLQYCIISGLNILEGGARKMCQEFVEILLTHTKKADWPVRILFTTSGQSRVLSPVITKDSKVATDNTFHQMKGKAPYWGFKLPD
ncbi:hypothetical protein FQN57_001339 [Myotisia sp. PD_48]|nr:hypothetical protein FQN57_001339 [Myotisia sp. PD_48]